MTEKAQLLDAAKASIQHARSLMQKAGVEHDEQYIIVVASFGQIEIPMSYEIVKAADSGNSAAREMIESELVESMRSIWKQCDRAHEITAAGGGLRRD